MIKNALLISKPVYLDDFNGFSGQNGDSFIESYQHWAFVLWAHIYIVEKNPLNNCSQSLHYLAQLFAVPEGITSVTIVYDALVLLYALWLWCTNENNHRLSDVPKAIADKAPILIQSSHRHVCLPCIYAKMTQNWTWMGFMLAKSG